MDIVIQLHELWVFRGRLLLVLDSMHNLYIPIIGLIILEQVAEVEVEVEVEVELELEVEVEVDIRIYI